MPAVSENFGGKTSLKETEHILEVRDVKKHFPIRSGVFSRKKGAVYAVDGVSFDVKRGEVLGLVGESGCGKTTLGRCLARLYKVTSGNVLFKGANITSLGRSDMKEVRRALQVIFQDPFESLNPRHTISEIISEPFEIHGIGNSSFRRAEVGKLMDIVGLSREYSMRYPHEFSGGQRQRIGIARALALKPELVICDEPVSALDVSIQSQILNLLLELQKEFGLSIVFIAHDLAVVRHISDRVAVMYLGKIVEITDADTIYMNPVHPYTRALISAIPMPDPGRRSKRQVLKGEVPSPSNPPGGCSFRTRCPLAFEKCTLIEPQLRQVPESGISHLAACHLA